MTFIPSLPCLDRRQLPWHVRLLDVILRRFRVVPRCERCPNCVTYGRIAELLDENRCTVTAASTGGRCQLAADHEDGHVFPIDDEFMRALDDGDLIIGGGSRRRKP